MLQLRKCFTLLFFIICGFVAKAQSSDDSVKIAVNKLFTAMLTADANLLTESFADSAVLQTIVEKNGITHIETEAVKDFAASMSKYQAKDLDERIVFNTIKIDGPLAIVWAPYNFFFKGKFSHCGIDSFQLVHVNGQWKIQYLIDTRNKSGCQPN